MSDISSPRSPSPSELTGAQNKRRRLQDVPDSSPRYSSPDELGADDSRHTSSRPSRLTSRGRSVQRQDDLADDRSPSPDELDHTRYRRGEEEEEEGRSSTQDVSRSRSQTPPTPENEDEDDDDDDDAQSAEVGAPAKKPCHYKLKYSILAHSAGIAQTKFSPDGEWLASVSADGTAKIWLASTGKLVHTLVGHLAGLSALSWSPDNLIIATGSDDKTIRLWDITTGQQVRQPWEGHHNYVFSLAFSPKGNILASGSYDEALFIWDVRGARQMRSLPAHSDPIGSVDFTTDGTLVASCATDGLIRVWDTASGQCLRTIVHEDNAKVASLQFSPNGKYIAAWTVDNCIRLWDFVTGQCKKTYQGHKNSKYSIAGSFGVWEEEAFLVSPSEDGRIVFWNVKTKNILQDIKAHGDAVMCVGTDATSSRIVSCDRAGYIKVWEPAEEGEVQDGDQIPMVTDGMKNVDLINGDAVDGDDAMDEADAGSEASQTNDADELDGGTKGPAMISVTRIPAPARASALTPPKKWELPEQGPPPADQLEFQRGLRVAGLDGVADDRPLANEEDVDVKVEDLMQEVVHEYMNDGVDAEEQIKSEMDSRI